MFGVALRKARDDVAGTQTLANCRFGLELGWQIVGVVGMCRRIADGKATGVAFVTGGLLEFLITAVIVGWVLGSAWYLLRR